MSLKLTVMSLGLPLDRLGIYLPGACQADNLLAHLSTTSAAMDLVILPV